MAGDFPHLVEGVGINLQISPTPKATNLCSDVGEPQKHGAEHKHRTQMCKRTHCLGLHIQSSRTGKK